MILFGKKKTSLSILTGKKATIVEKFAASELQKYLKKITGVDVPIVEQDESGTSPVILLGQPKTNPAVQSFAGSILKDLPEDSLLIKTANDKLILTGKGEQGVLYSVYTFLEKYVGCRWYAPGEEGELIPQLKSLELEDIENIESPAFPYRGMMAHRDNPEEIVTWIDWMAKQKMNYFLIWLSNWQKVKEGIMDEVRKRGIELEIGHHSFFCWLPPGDYFADHPEYFCLKDGKRRICPEGAESTAQANWYQPCTTNPEVARIITENIKAFIKDNPEVKIIDLWPNDIPEWCECEKCVAFDTQGNDEELLHKPIITRRYISFCNTVAEAIAKEFPDKRLSVIAYHTAVIPADDMVPAPNIDICFAPYDECYAHFLGEKDCKRNSFFAENLQKWVQQSSRVYLYGYYLKSTWGQLPFPINGRIVEDMRYFKEIGMMGANTQAELITWKTQGLIYYTYAKALWDSDVTLDEILDEYCAGFYKDSASMMKKYFRRLEDAMRDTGKKIDPLQGACCGPFPAYVFLPEVISECKAYLDEAEKTTQDEIILQRIHIQKVHLRYAELVASAIHKWVNEGKHREALNIVEDILHHIRQNPEWKGILLEMKTQDAYAEFTDSYAEYWMDILRKRLKTKLKEEVKRC